MITERDIILLDNVLNKLKNKLYGLNAEYKSEIIKENVQFNKTVNLGYKPYVRVYVYLTGDLKIPLVSTPILEEEVKQSLNKTFKFVFPKKHTFIQNHFALTYKFFYNGQEMESREIIESDWYKTYKENFISKNKSGTQRLEHHEIDFSINYYDLKLEQSSDIEDLNFTFISKVKSFNYYSSDVTVEITDDIFNEFGKEMGWSPSEIKESLISVYNTKSTEYDSNIVVEFARAVDLHSVFSEEVKNNIGWKYESLCYSLENPKEIPWDYTQTALSTVRNFEKFLKEKFKN